MGKEISDSMIITKVLMTLPASYRHFVSAWESAPAGERKLDNLKTRLMTEESRNTSQEDKNGNALSTNVQRGRSRRGRGGRGGRGGTPRGSSRPGKYVMRPDTPPAIVRSAKEAIITKDQRTLTTPQKRSYTTKVC